MKKRQNVHTYVCLVLRLRRTSQVDLAKSIGCTPQTLRAVLIGERTSRRIQERIAHEVGMPSWERLGKAASDFEASFASRLAAGGRSDVSGN